MGWLGRVGRVELSVDVSEEPAVVGRTAAEYEDSCGVGLGHHSPGPRLAPVDCPGTTAPHHDALKLRRLLSPGRELERPGHVRVLWRHGHRDIGQDHGVHVRTVRVALEPRGDSWDNLRHKNGIFFLPSYHYIQNLPSFGLVATGDCLASFQEGCAGPRRKRRRCFMSQFVTGNKTIKMRKYKM
jgi:hypothetical protein